MEHFSELEPCASGPDGGRVSCITMRASSREVCYERPPQAWRVGDYQSAHCCPLLGTCCTYQLSVPSAFADVKAILVQETFGAMAKTEKIFYILEQVRLCLDRKDYIRRVSMPVEGSLSRPSAHL